MSSLEEKLLKQTSTAPKDNTGAIMAQFYEQCQDVEKEWPKQIPVLQIGESKICTFKNFSCIIGKAKSRKTFFTSLIVADCLKTLPPDKEQVIWFDTEQDEERISQVHKRILKMSGLSVDEFKRRFHMVHLRPKELSQIKAIVETSIYNIKELGLVIIDGIRDLLSNINDPDESTEIQRKLLKWTAELQIHMLCVLHTNKGDSNARGHIGSEIINKGEAIISVELDEQDPDKQSIIKGQFVRDPNFKPIIMRVNDDGIPEIMGEYIDHEKVKAKVPTDFNMEAHYGIVQRVFEDTDTLGIKDLKETLIYVAETFNFTIAQSKLSSWIQHYVKHSFINSGDKRMYTITERAKNWEAKTRL